MAFTPRCSLAGVVAAVALFVQALPAVAAPASQLPDWDAAKPKPKPAELPDWDAAKPKPKPKPKKPKKPGETPAEAPAETPVETPAEAPPAETPAEPPPAETPAEPPPAEVKPAEPAAVVEGPSEAPEVDTGGSKEALAVAKREMIAGGVILGLGIGGFGVLGAGVAIKGGAEDDGDEDRLKQGNTLVAVGAMVGVIGTVMGLTLIGEGVRDRRAARPKAQARVRVAPTFGGLMISGRF